MEADRLTLELPGYTVTVVRDPHAAPVHKLAGAEGLRRFAEAESYRQLAGVAAWAQTAVPEHLSGLKDSGGMATSRKAGTLIREMNQAWAAAEVAAAQDISTNAATAAIGRAKDLLAEHSSLLTALEAGRIGAAHVRVILEQAALIKAPVLPGPPRPARNASAEEWEAWDLSREAHAREQAAAEARAAAGRSALGADLLADAEGRTPAGIRSRAKALRQKHHPESFTTRTRKAVQDRYVRIGESDDDGMCYLEAKTTGLVAEALWNRINQAAALLKRNPAETRTMDQLRHDAFADYCLSGPEATGIFNIKPTVILTVPSTILPGTPGAPAPTLSPEADREAWSRAQARAQTRTQARTQAQAPTQARSPAQAQSRALADADGNGNADGQPDGRCRSDAEILTRLVAAMMDPGAAVLPPGAEVPQVQRFGPIDQESVAIMMAAATSWHRAVTDPVDGAIVAFSGTRYAPTPLQRLILSLRDGTCRFPGCRQPADRCEPDHAREFQHGGPTNLDNLHSASKRCHRFKSLGLYRVTLQPDGMLKVTTLGGTVRTTRPAAPWAPGRSAGAPRTAPDRQGDTGNSGGRTGQHTHSTLQGGTVASVGATSAAAPLRATDRGREQESFLAGQRDRDVRDAWAAATGTEPSATSGPSGPGHWPAGQYHPRDAWATLPEDPDSEALSSIDWDEVANAWAAERKHHAFDDLGLRHDPAPWDGPPISNEQWRESVELCQELVRDLDRYPFRGHRGTGPAGRPVTVPAVRRGTSATGLDWNSQATDDPEDGGEPPF